MTTSPLADGTRVASITVLTLLTTAVATALIGAAIAGLGEPGGAPGAPLLRAASVQSSPSPGPSPSTASPSAEPSPSSEPSSVPVTAATPRPLRFSWSVHRVSAGRLGRSWHAGCPVGPAALRSATFTHWTFDGGVTTGTIVLHRDVLKRSRTVFRAMFEQRFPLRRVHPVSAYGGSDDRSMAADNTSAFNCRPAVAAGRPSWSRHAYGKAIDVNPVENPYLFRGDVLPPAGKRYTDRGTARPGLIRARDPIHDAFVTAGFRWGGTFSNPDYQHFDR